MKTIYYTAASLDGFIADPDHSLDWLFQFPDPQDTGFEAFSNGVGAVAMGSHTYEWVLPHLPSDDEGRTQWAYPQPTWVFTSRDLPRLETGTIEFVQGDVRPVYDAMREAAGDKNIWLIGGGELVGQFVDHGLLDEIIVTIASVVLGSGAPLLPRSITTPPLALRSVTQHGTDFVRLHYDVGRVQGSS